MAMMMQPFSVAQQMVELWGESEHKRLDAFKRAWQSYRGEIPKPLKATKSDPRGDDNVIVNFARVIVNKGVSFLFGQDVGFELDETQQTVPEKWLMACWLANRKMTFLQKLALSGAVCGHAFVKIVPRLPYPRLIALDPSTVFPTWDPDDIETVTRDKVQYNTLATDPRTGRAIPTVKRQIIERNDVGAGWTITDQTSTGDSLQWQTTGTTIWPWPWAPIVDCQNLPSPNEYWGMSDLEDDIVAPVKAMSFVLSNVTRIIRHHAHPKTWGKGFGAKQLEIGVDETIILNSPEAELHNLEMESDLASSIDLYKRLKEALHEIAQVPEVATGKLDSTGALSGVALLILYQPLIEKTETKRRTYGDLLVELNRCLLALAGFGDDNHTVIHWPGLLPSDPIQERQALLLDKELGVSQETILHKLGYDPAVEQQKRQAEASELGDKVLTAFERGQTGEQV